jgi:hypothetical protein
VSDLGTRNSIMKKIAITVAVAGLTALATTSGASAAGSPTCAGYDQTGWKNHGAHVLTYVNGDGGAAGGRPAHRMDGVFMAPPGASFCIGHAHSAGR